MEMPRRDIDHVRLPMLLHDRRRSRNTRERIRWIKSEEQKYEPELIKKIVKEASAKLPPIPLPIKHIVGLDSRFEQEVEPHLDTKSLDTVCMLEIYGAGGIGKTTFALNIYNKIRHQFEASSFLADVREKSSKRKGLEDLQKTLMSEMGEETEAMMGSTFNGDFEIKRKLSNKRVLLVLDDVDKIEQLEALAGGGDWFGSGSRIIITTRDTTMVDKHKMDGVDMKKYKMGELNGDDSLELFCLHAFN
ncbi:disease resistance-like protein DSC1 [Lotus japonicus]|uniref:disease resistance-like protein DSC1 n=1 Tax=Lotus japonicus TaxID=34305 RepID=UPI0025856C47|nr:disease resistance-like protein DSC1 [Lotus japonicus]